MDEAEAGNLVEIIHKTLLLIEHQLLSWSNIRIEKDLAVDLPPIMCDRNSIMQVLINLLTNAADAMPHGGKIIIRTRYDANNERIMLQVADTGEGIPEKNLSKIFDPFFTTKDVGEGTGLGLSIVMSIIQAHGGEVRVDSEPGQGAMFTVSLPEKPPEMPVSIKNGDGSGRFDE